MQPISRAVAIAITALGLSLAVGVQAQTASAKPAAGAKAQIKLPKPGTYKIDLDHSHAYFVIRHLDISRFMGRFDQIQGEFTVGEMPDRNTAKASIRVDSINTKQAKIDEHLRSADFFDATRFPTMEFTATRVKWNAGGEGTMAGKLTIKGVTRPVEFSLRATGAGAGLKGEIRSGFEAKTTLRRSDYGILYGLPSVVGDLVEITLSVEGILQ
jgi:polyisoprenoid-binding protein YceI